MSQLGIARLAVEVLGHSVRRLGRAIFIFFVLIVKTAVEVRRSFVLIRSTVLHQGSVSVDLKLRNTDGKLRAVTYISVSCDKLAHVA